MKHLLIGAVSALSIAGAAQAAPKEINFWHAMGGQLGEITDKFAADFNASQSEYQINAIYKGDYTETMTSAIAAFRAKEQPHIVQVFEVGTATMIAAEGKGAVYPVYKLMADAGVEFNQDDYLPAVVSYYTDTDNRLLSLPFNSSTPVMWYNKTKFEELGIPVPTTWDEVEEAAKKAKAAGVEAPLSFGWQSWTQIETYSAWHDIPMGTAENGFGGLDTEFTFNNDAVVNHIQRIADMGKEGLFKYGGRRGDSRGMFVNGETIMWINSSAYYGGFKKDITDWEFGQAMLPLDTAVAEKPQNSIIGGATLWVLSGHDQGDYKGVAEFFKFVSAPEQQAYWHQATGYVPITTAAYVQSQEEGFYDENPGTDTAIKQLSLNTPTANSKGVRFGNFVQIRDVINEELEAVWSGQKDAKQAMDDAVSRGNDLLRKFQSANE
ncbi:sn-glycerol-3-phosphate ABC transporter substrate-binding protein UgpB [Pikeienuella piscinae]|uniref:sn-glycerol-3-phosphate-binding periplasmic protein UgpB n=1 Tax=Pikeienuella piscinae TaxID=2748098 RepID=A0A7L5BWQ0_9RHOB|nr:sn-glycerol-3-phosphate ABC transporter substrate-binding protein UgpB [Pikeienuella piscinae]QIE54019.1 sn-glycerol-3-phosphate ABC transporter substrate-binding protein UgpB [Pikeienuella piscinae]